jgi:hypothetical protein
MTFIMLGKSDHIRLMTPFFETKKKLSGTVYAKEQITVTSSVGYEISGSFSASTVTGTWPAFWYVYALTYLWLVHY